MFHSACCFSQNTSSASGRRGADVRYGPQAGAAGGREGGERARRSSGPSSIGWRVRRYAAGQSGYVGDPRRRPSQRRRDRCPGLRRRAQGPAVGGRGALRPGAAHARRDRPHLPALRRTLPRAVTRGHRLPLLPAPGARPLLLLSAASAPLGRTGTPARPAASSQANCRCS